MRDYIETFTGIKFDFLNPLPEQFNIVDIAHALSMTCRYTGHSNKFYSVGEHSWHMARMLGGFPREIQLAALLHDGSEAYITDIASPVKRNLPDYRILEDHVMEKLCEKFKVEYPLHPAIKYADMVMLSIEAHFLIPSRGNDWEMWQKTKRPAILQEYKPIGMLPAQAKELFLDKYYELTS